MDGSSLVIMTALLVASIIDLRTRRVPNLITFPLLFAALVFHHHSGSLPSALGGAALGFAWFLVPYALHWVGAGDVKLMAAAGAWVGWPGAVPFVLYCGASGAVWVLLLSLHKADLKSLWLSAAGGFGKCTRQFIRTAGENSGQKVPYAGTVFIGYIAFKLFGGAF